MESALTRSRRTERKLQVHHWKYSDLDNKIKLLYVQGSRNVKIRGAMGCVLCPVVLGIKESARGGGGQSYNSHVITQFCHGKSSSP